MNKYVLKIEGVDKIKTVFGIAKINNKGYYQITTNEKGNVGKTLHRLIFKKFYGYIPKGYVIHHKDGNKLNNCINNLQLLNKSEHDSYHMKGDNNPMYNMKGDKNHNFKSIIKIYKRKSKTCVQEFIYVARFRTNKGRMSVQSVYLDEVIKKVEEFINSKENIYNYTDYEY